MALAFLFVMLFGNGGGMVPACRRLAIFVFWPRCYRLIPSELGNAAHFLRAAALTSTMERGMRLLMVAMAAALVAVPVVPAYSQMGHSIAKPMPKGPEEKKNEKTPQQKKAEEKAYNDAITRIPDQKFDPWGKVR
jgi:hypothetical protein